jgi:hypothetical protein
MYLDFEMLINYKNQFQIGLELEPSVLSHPKQV